MVSACTIAFSDQEVPQPCVAFDDLTDSVAQDEDGKSRVIFTRPEALHGVRVEYLSTATVESTLDRVRSLVSDR